MRLPRFSLRNFRLVLTGIAFAWLLPVQAIVFTLGLSGSSGWSTAPFFVTGMLLLVAHQYHTRHVRRGAAIAVTFGIAVLFLPMAFPRSATPAIPARRVIPDHLRPASAEIGELALKPGSQAEFIIRFTGASPFHHYVLVSPAVRIRVADGSSTAVQVKEPLV
jgi:hypothetical protein